MMETLGVILMVFAGVALIGLIGIVALWIAMIKSGT